MKTKLQGKALFGASLLVAGSSAGIVASCSDDNELGWLRAEHFGDLSHTPAPRGRFDEALDEACGAGALTSRGSSLLMRRPYLQRVTPEGAWLLWTSRPAGAASVVVRDPADRSGEEQVFTAEIDGSAPIPGGSQWVARLSGLEPGRIHCYEILDAEGLLVESTGFMTAPADDEATVRFVALSDLGKGELDQLAVLGQMVELPFELVLMGGDLAYDDGRPEEFERLFDIYADVSRKVPLMVASGNHDYSTDDGAPFREAFALFDSGSDAGRERWYSFDWGPMHVAVLDTELTDDETQLAWLDADLAATDAPWKVALMHRPAFSSGAHGSDGDVQDYMVPLLERHGVQLVIAGHDHHYERTHSIGGVTYMVAGAGGIGTRGVDSSDFTAFSERVSHFVHVTIEGDELILRAIDATGVDFDSLRLTL